MYIYIYIFKLYTHLSGSRACPNDHVQRQPSERSITLKSQKSHLRWHVPSRLQSEGGTRGFSLQFWSGMLSVLSSRWVEYAAASPSVLQEAPEWVRVLMVDFESNQIACHMGALYSWSIHHHLVFHGEPRPQRLACAIRWAHSWSYGWVRQQMTISDVTEASL